MLDRCDRVQIAVHDAAKAALRFKQLLGGEVSRRDHSRYLDARRTILAIGESEFELCEPDGAGRTRKFLDARGEDARQRQVLLFLPLGDPSREVVRIPDDVACERHGDADDQRDV